jgi:hypothetical protein
MSPLKLSTTAAASSLVALGGNSFSQSSRSLFTGSPGRVATVSSCPFAAWACTGQSGPSIHGEDGDGEIVPLTPADFFKITLA